MGSYNDLKTLSNCHEFFTRFFGLESLTPVPYFVDFRVFEDEWYNFVDECQREFGVLKKHYLVTKIW